MPSSLYVALSAQSALMHRMDSIASNVANAGTAGYRADGVKFDSLITRTGAYDVAFASGGQDYITTEAGPLTQTGNPLDVAVSGDAYLAIQTPSGIVYTRDGRMRMSETGALQTLNGFPVLDAGNSPLLLDTSAGPPVISRDGMIAQRGAQVGAIGLFSLDPTASLTRADNSGVVPSKPAVPLLDFGKTSISQGFVEGSNINPVREMTRMIAVQRSFESISSSMDMTDRTVQDAIKTLGSPS